MHMHRLQYIAIHLLRASIAIHLLLVRILNLGGTFVLGAVVTLFLLPTHYLQPSIMSSTPSPPPNKKAKTLTPHAVFTEELMAFIKT
jgi:hypothetical protein